MAKLVQPDIVMMDRYYGEIQELDKKINLQASKLVGGGESWCLDLTLYDLNSLEKKYRFGLEPKRLQNWIVEVEFDYCYSLDMGCICKLEQMASVQDVDMEITFQAWLSG